MRYKLKNRKKPLKIRRVNNSDKLNKLLFKILYKCIELIDAILKIE